MNEKFSSRTINPKQTNNQTNKQELKLIPNTGDKKGTCHCLVERRERYSSFRGFTNNNNNSSTKSNILVRGVIVFRKRYANVVKIENIELND